jgi:hypothetical protein
MYQGIMCPWCWCLGSAPLGVVGALYLGIGCLFWLISSDVRGFLEPSSLTSTFPGFPDSFA